MAHPDHIINLNINSLYALSSNLTFEEACPVPVNPNNQHSTTQDILSLSSVTDLSLRDFSNGLVEYHSPQ